jgi:hypothetical protein
MRAGRGIAFAAAVGLTTLGASEAGAQRVTDTCRTAEPVGWIGIEQFECNCTVALARTARANSPAGEAQWTFRSEPEVRNVADNSPAAGVLRRGDVIVAVDGHPITTSEGGRRFSRPTPGERMTLTVRRDGRRHTVRLTPVGLCPTDSRLGRMATPRVAAGPGADPTPRAPGSPPNVAGNRPTPLPPEPPGRLLPTGHLGFGYSCSDCGWRGRGREEPRWYFSAPPQVYSVEAGSPAERAGLQRGDLITHVDGEPITTEAGARRFGAIMPDESVRYTIRRGGSVSRITLRAADRSSTAEQSLGREIRQSIDRIGRLRDVDDVRRELVELSRRLEASAAAVLDMPTPRADTDSESNQLRYSGVVGNAEVEVRGSGSVIATIVEPGRDLVIITDGARIRIRAPDVRDERNGGR